ncbi:MAG: alpha-mannosidase [Thermoproteota archaeon]
MSSINVKQPNILFTLIEMLQEKYTELAKYREEFSWKFFQGNVSEVYEMNFDDSSWNSVKLPVAVDLRKGEAWFRCAFSVPEKINGIDVSGSTIKIFSYSPILAKTDFFVDSKKVLTADYWAELRGPRIIVNQKAKPKENHVVAIHLFPKYEPVGIPNILILYSNVEKVLFELDSFIQELRFAQILDKKYVNQVVEEFDLGVFNKEISDLVNEIEKARSKLSVLSQKAKEFRVHLVAHAHIDMNWLWPWEDTVETIKSTFSTMVNLMDKYPDFRFSQSQAVTYKVVEEEFPELFEKISEYVKNGNWEITASMWVESDLNMVGTEALVRQFLLAKNYIKEKFGVEPKICWEPDTFGHIWTLPQVLQKTGVRYYYFMRCNKGYPLFWWEGPDGSKVLAFTSIYNNFVTPKNIVDLAEELYNRYGLKTSMFVYGVGDHGGGATIEDIEAAYEIQKKPTLPSVFFSSAQKFFEEIEKQANEIKIPVVKDELNFTFDGCYTTHSDIKRYNRLCERALIDAEKVCALSGIYPREKLKSAWTDLLFNQFHDILDGSAFSEAYPYSRELAQRSLNTANKALSSSLEDIANRIRFANHGVPIVVFNTLSWNRVDIVKVKIQRDIIPSNPIAISSNGKEKVPVQLTEDGLLFTAKVPSLGYKTYYIVQGKEELGSSLLLFEDGATITVENEYFKVEIEKNSGTIRSLYDKVAKKFVLRRNRHPETKPIFNNLFQVLYELPHPMSAWIIGEIDKIENLIRGAEVELVEKGPVRATIKVTHKYKNSKIIQRIMIYRSIPRIDFLTLIDWKEISNGEVEAPMLKVSFTPVLNKSKATFEIPFGYIERIADGAEVPALRWIDVSDDEYGLSLLNDSKYGFDVKGNTIRMTLIRTSYSPDPKPDLGVHEVLYSIYPHKGDWKAAQTYRRGYELNHPFESVVVTVPSKEGTEPEEKSFVQIAPDNIVLSCFKLAEDSNDYILRLYDATGEGAEAHITFDSSIIDAKEVDLMEKPAGDANFNDNRLFLSFKPFEIKTIRIKLKRY